jgi:hypothetical protein
MMFLKQCFGQLEVTGAGWLLSCRILSSRLLYFAVCRKVSLGVFFNIVIAALFLLPSSLGRFIVSVYIVAIFWLVSSFALSFAGGGVLDQI